jgi:hypothetical protein
VNVGRVTPTILATDAFETCFCRRRRISSQSEISRVLKLGIPEGQDINIRLLEHVSPIEWETSFFTASNPDDIR